MQIVSGKSTRPARSVFMRLALVGLLVRATIPLGYMPGNLLAGEYAVLCPTAVPAAVMQVIQGNGHNHAEHNIDSDRDCPIGSALQPSWAPNDAEQPVVELAAISFDRPNSIRLLSKGSHRHYHARAPPLI